MSPEQVESSAADARGNEFERGTRHEFKEICLIRGKEGKVVVGGSDVAEIETSREADGQADVAEGEEEEEGREGKAGKAAVAVPFLLSPSQWRFAMLTRDCIKRELISC